MLHFLVFSFNRGEFLHNCVQSILRCAPDCAITIWDDNSSDELTRQTLTQLHSHEQVSVRQPSLARLGGEGGDNSEQGKHGGLYNNLQSAWTALPDDSLICCIQDDMQLVRPLAADEIQRWADLLASGRHRGFMQPAFLKAVSADIRSVPEKQGYCIDRQHRSAGAWYSDVFMTSTRLLRESNWQFQPREAGNEQQARLHFDQMVYLKDPFVAWLPGAPAWRGKKRTLAMRWAEKSRQCGFYPFEIMTASAAAGFRQRPPESLPLAETCLKLQQDRTLSTPWFYYPLQGRRGLKLLNRLQLLI